MAQQMTFGEVIRAVGSVPAETPVRFDTGKYFRSVGAYRGDHEQIAISGRRKEVMTADEVLVRLGAIIGVEIGESQCVMSESTPVWHSEYGECESLAVVGFRMSKKGELVFQTEYQEWD